MTTAAPNATYPVITGTATTAPASREISRKPSLATSFAFMGASVHRLGARVPVPRRPIARQCGSIACRSRSGRRIGLSDQAESRERACDGGGRAVTEAHGLVGRERWTYVG